MNPILVASDFSPRSDRALRRAMLLAKQTGSALTLLHVVAPGDPGEIIEAKAAAAHATLAATARTLREVDAVGATSQVRIGHVAETIAAVAVETGAGVIVLGPPRRRWSDVFTGSTADRVIRAAAIPVLIARQPPAAAYSRAMLAMDFEPVSRLAAHAAGHLQLISRSTISVVHVLDAAARDPVQAPLARQASLDAATRRAWRQTRHRLHALVEALPIAIRRARIVAPAGSIASTLLDCVAQEAADVIVTGTRNRERMSLGRLLEGSVAQDLARASPRDVLIVPEPGRAAPAQHARG